MRRNPAALAAILILLVAAAGASAQTVTLRMAANAPTGSPWDFGLKRLAAEFDRVSGGKVRLVFPQSAHVSTEADMIQKMRLGVDGALLTTLGMAVIYPDSLALSLPGFMRDDAEFDAVLEAVVPVIKSKLADRYVVLALTKGGWVRFFSRTEIEYPSDLSKLRVCVDPTDEKVAQLIQSLGARVVKGSTSDFLLQMNSGAVDATCSSPIFIAALWSQLRGKVQYMSSLKAAPFIGAVVFNKASWERVPAELRPKLEKVVTDMARQISADSVKLEAEAIGALDGIKSPPAPADASAKWVDAIAQRRSGLIAQMFSKDILDAIDSALTAVRKNSK
jgi:TRAP-type transport system periplasmic protein